MNGCYGYVHGMAIGGGAPAPPPAPHGPPIQCRLTDYQLSSLYFVTKNIKVIILYFAKYRYIKCCSNLSFNIPNREIN